MNVFYIITNSLKDPNLELTLKIRDYLEGRGKTCYYQEEKRCEKEFLKTDADRIPENTDCVIVLGGDGTLIQAARDLKDREIPLFGVNLGTLGYLVETERSQVLHALDRLIAGAYELEQRIMIQGTIFKGGIEELKDTALNDIVISRSGPLRLLNYKIYVNGQFLNEYSADGIIISTPTGSTGYSLSAGGPIVEPTASMLVITPICSHALNTRSIVLSGKDRLKVEVGLGRRQETEEAEVSFDGHSGLLIRTGDYIEIVRAEQKTRIVKLNRQSFLENLRRKMSTN